jgi:hypothetical protein
MKKEKIKRINITLTPEQIKKVKELQVKLSASFSQIIRLLIINEKL